MPRIVITADVHLGITSLPRVQKLINDIRAEGPDAIVIGGDIGEGAENIEIVLEEFASICIPVAACTGNHDIWNYDKKHPSEKLWGKTLPEIAKKAGIIWLDNENLIVGDVAIVGSIAWYDYSAQDPAFKVSEEETWKRKREFDADAWQVDWPWNDIEFCRMIEPGFRDRLEKAQSDEKIREIVVVTHSPIFEGQIKRKPRNFKWGFSNAYYGNLTFGKIAGDCGKVTHAIAGHTHSGMEGTIKISGHPARVVTLNSQYNEPIYIVLDLADS